MSNPFFSFKKFTVFHDKSAHKVGVDGVTLGSWADVKEATNILDIGTGSGLIALMLAQRTTGAKIVAVEFDKDSFCQAKENFQASEWNERMEVFHSSLQNFATSQTEKYDLIVSNPPFFENSLKAKGQSRTNARHTDTLSQDDLLNSVDKLLTKNGRFCVILPVLEAQKLVQKAEKLGFYLNKLTKLSHTDKKEPKRWLLEFSYRKTELKIENLVIKDDKNNYTEEYYRLVKDFYLKL